MHPLKPGSQCDQIWKHLTLRPGRIITTYQAYDLYKITRLPDRIRDLREKGYKIEGPVMRLPSGKSCAVYSLA